jgi:signal transduction histidine kinase
MQRIVLPALAAALTLLSPGPRLSSAGEDAGPGNAVLTRIRDIRALSGEAAKGHAVRIRGTVTYLDEQWPSGLIVHDGDMGQFVLPQLDRPYVGLRVGDRVEVLGRTKPGGFAPNVSPASVRRVGRGRLPRAARLSYSALLTGRHDCEYVEISGVGQRAWFADSTSVLFVEVAVDGGIIRASFWDAERADIGRLVDARFRLRGNAGAIFDPAGQLRGVSLLSGRTRDVVVEEPPPVPFTLPVRPLSSLYRYSSGGEVGRRVRVRGVVTAHRTGHPTEIADFTTSHKYRDVRHVFYVRDETGAARVETAQDMDLQPGDTVDVAGFPLVTPTRPELRNAVFERLGKGEDPRPLSLLPATALTPDKDADLVSAEARVLGVVASPTERALVLQVGETAFEAVLDVSHGSAGMAEIPKGSLVSVKGVYSYQDGPPPSFRLLLRSAADVTLLQRAPWWTLRHTAVVSVIVALVASAAGLWVRMIANRNLMVREQYRAILAERSRLARELHDTVEQGLAGINLQLEAVAGSLEAAPETARRSLHIAKEMLRYSMEETRRSVMDLRSQALENQGIAGALTDLAQRMTSGTPLAAEVTVAGAPRTLDASVEHHLLRIGVEALTNAIKHSGASRIDVELRFSAEQTELLVSDNGCGFAKADGELAVEHFGLRGIRERVDKMGGALRLESRPGGGARLAVSLPVRERPQAAVTA